ncbi:hypothetical protein [Streptomyces sp. Y1]|uniref:Type II secretion system protein GspF domain-containing protein n=1 Tax=Streptomyces sp. Y1 TaxID=3238634 RepID=A0AB39TUQ5_9ACTN
MLKLGRDIRENGRRAALRRSMKATAALRESLELAGVAGGVPREVRLALWMHYRRSIQYGRFCLAVLIWTGFSWGLLYLLRPLDSRPVAVLIIMAPLIIVAAMTVLASLFVPFFMLIEMNRYTRYRPVAILADLVGSLSEVLPAGRSDRTNLLMAASRELKSAELMIGRMRFWRGTVPMISSRQPELKRHSRLVITRLRKAAAGLDKDADAALKELISLLIQIADNYAVGHVGALLEFTEEEEESLEPSWSVVDSAVMAVRGGMRRVVTILAAGAVAWCGTKIAGHYGYHVEPSLTAIIVIVFSVVPAAAPSIVGALTAQGK